LFAKHEYLPVRLYDRERARILSEYVHLVRPGAEKAFGFVPNISAVLAESPATLKAYMTMSRIFDESSLTPAERQVAIPAINEYNACHYCVAARSRRGPGHPGRSRAEPSGSASGRRAADRPD
jgi:alkylhydroperoxidase family enzyme